MLEASSREDDVEAQMTAESTPLVELSDAMANAAERAGASTVLVDARRRIPASGIAWSADGVIVTANHVVERDDEIFVGMPDDARVKARLAGRDPGSDIAVLRAEGGFTPAERASEGSVRVGHFALALGRPSAGGIMASLGVVSAMGGQWRTMRGGQVGAYVRSDATLYPGFSGGPLVDLSGRVIGLNSSAAWRASGLTIPLWAAAPIVEQLLQGGRVKRGYLGVGSQPARLPSALAARLDGQESGLLIVGVEAGSPADQAGLLLGDILVRAGGTRVEDTDDLHALLGPESVGKPMPVTVLRGGTPTELTVTAGERG
jgi:S1-C subfamily serine protease